MKIQPFPSRGSSSAITTIKFMNHATPGRLLGAAALALALATPFHAQANLITNASFEADGSATFNDSDTELTGTAKNAGAFGGYFPVSSWSTTTRIWFLEKGTETFPDGSYALQIDGNGDAGGIDVLAQGGLSLTAGKTYRLSFAIWGGNPSSTATEKLDVRLTRDYGSLTDPTSGTGVLVIDDKTSVVTTNGSFETVTVLFTPTVTSANYALQFFADNAIYKDDHICIDKVELTEATELIANGSFEDDVVAATDDSFSELPGDAKNAGSIGGDYAVSAWSRSSRIWLMQKGTETFPDGNYAYKIDGNGAVDGSGAVGNKDILAQGGLPLFAGKTYRLSFAIWGGDQYAQTTEKLDVRLTRGYSNLLDPASGTGVVILDDKTTDADDGLFETVTVDFTPAVTDTYALQFFADTLNVYNDRHICIDKIALSALAGTYADWASANGVAGAADVDSDNDGVDNGVEYFMGITSADPVFTANPALNSTNTITWPMSATFDGSYEVETSTNLGTWTPVVPRPDPVTYTLPSGAPGGKNFVRLRVTPN